MPAMDPQPFLKLAFILGIIAEILIRNPYKNAISRNKIKDRRVDSAEKLELLLLFVAGYLIPALYIFTPWLNFANYRLPDWAGLAGVIMLTAAVYIFWRAHVDLGLNWSPSLEMREQHTLITHGVYSRIRHPMYASQWLWVIAQPLLLQNWIAGFLGVVAFAPLYFLRVPREEQMMLDHFGDEYRRYMDQSGRVMPPLVRRAN
jgi:protein-S-isoprenylcysteine O-methyltransferase Ste14